MSIIVRPWTTLKQVTENFLDRLRKLCQDTPFEAYFSYCSYTFDVYSGEVINYQLVTKRSTLGQNENQLTIMGRLLSSIKCKSYKESFYAKVGWF